MRMSQNLFNRVIYFSLLFSFQLHYSVHADDEDWFFENFEEKIENVNEGEVKFLTETPVKKVHSHRNWITISADSLETGWTSLKQCHENLDALDAVQISFNQETTRRYYIESYSDIGRVWIDKSNIELEDIKKDAKLCISLQTKNIHIASDGHVMMRNGPYMRRFLDGYYPIHVNLNVDYPCELMRFIKTKNSLQSGFAVKTESCSVIIDSLFEGKLYTELLFEKISRD